MNKAISWAPMQPSDLSSVDHIGNSIHNQLQERREIFEEKFTQFPQGCRKIVMNSRIVGYGIAHPWILHTIPPLDSFLVTLPQTPDCIYIHDITIMPIARGNNSAGLYISELETIARSLSIYNIALVSVYGTISLWERYGFCVVNDQSLEKKVESYGDTARYMVKSISDDYKAM